MKDKAVAAKKAPKRDLESGKWTFYEYIEVAHELGIVGPSVMPMVHGVLRGTHFGFAACYEVGTQMSRCLAPDVSRRFAPCARCGGFSLRTVESRSTRPHRRRRERWRRRIRSQRAGTSTPTKNWHSLRSKPASRPLRSVDPTSPAGRSCSQRNPDGPAQVKTFVETGHALSSSLGRITISSEAIARIVGETARECYGVVGMAGRKWLPDTPGMP